MVHSDSIWNNLELQENNVSKAYIVMVFETI